MKVLNFKFLNVTVSVILMGTLAGCVHSRSVTREGPYRTVTHSTDIDHGEVTRTRTVDH